MQRKVTQRNASRAKMANTSFLIDGGQLVIRDGAYYRCLSAQETLRLFTLMADYRTMIVGAAVSEQREQERKTKERQGHKKPKWVQVDGQWVEAVEVADLEKEQIE